MRFRPTTIASIAAVAGMCALIFAMSAQNADDSTELSMGLVWHIIGFIVPGYDQMSPADQLYWQQMLDHPVRKTAHFLEYAVLGALTMNMTVRISRDCRESRFDEPAPGVEPRNTPPEARSDAGGSRLGPVNIVIARGHGLISWALATAYAVSDEAHQAFVPGRAFMVTDILIDSSGILVGVLVAGLVLHALARPRNPRA